MALTGYIRVSTDKQGEHGLVRLNIDPDETEQGLTDKACREIDLFVQTN